MDIMTQQEFKTLIEMVIMIVGDSKDKEEAISKLKSLSIVKEWPVFLLMSNILLFEAREILGLMKK